MNTEHLAAFRASPSFLFGSYEMPYAEFSDALKITDHAHAVLGSITLIKMVQPVARIAVTSKAVLGFSIHILLTVLDFAYDA
jgi:hypothetical protein